MGKKLKKEEKKKTATAGISELPFRSCFKLEKHWFTFKVV